MKTILVSGASGIVGYGILRSLKASRLDLRLIGIAMYEDSVAPGFCDIFLQAPPTKSSTYRAWLLDTITDHQVDMIIPGIEIDLYTWSDSLGIIEQHGAKVLMNDLHLVRLCKDKWTFFQELTHAKLECAIASSLDSSFDSLCHYFGLPFLLKPRQGFGSKGIVQIDSETSFSRYKQHMGTTMMAQPIVGNNDEEYTTSAFCNGKGGYYAIMTLRRKLSTEGFTEKAEVVQSDDFLDTINALCQHFRPTGPTNFQFRKCDDGIKLLEINPRVSSSTSIRTAFGYNENAMSVEYWCEGKIPKQPKIQRGKAVRYTEDFIFYENSIYL